MKLINKLVSSLLIFAFILSATVFKVAAAVLTFNDDVNNFLLCGVDDAAGNSDTIILLNADFKNGKIKILHIPRDTMVAYNGKRTKINSVYAISKSLGMSEKNSLTALKNYLSEALNISFDASAALDMASFVNIVDAVGGVTVVLDKELLIKKGNGEELLLLKGENKLSGKEALDFVRHRKSYPDADLGRINAQEMFVEAFIKKVASLDTAEIANLYKSAIENVTLDVSLSALSVILLFLNKSKYKEVAFYTLPGKTTLSNNISYYKIDRNKADIMLREFCESSRVNDGCFIFAE